MKTSEGRLWYEDTRELKPFLEYVASLSFDDVAKNGTPTWRDKIKIKMVKNITLNYDKKRENCTKIVIDMKNGDCLEYNPNGA